MGLFDFLKKKKETDEVPPSTWLPTQPPKNYQEHKPIEETFSITANKSDLKKKPKKKPLLTHLDENGELPFGWFYQNKDFTNKIEKEYSYFLNNWINSRGKGTLNEYSALKSLILYIQDSERLCRSKGECFSKWFSDCIADQEYIEKRLNDLKNVEQTL